MTFAPAVTPGFLRRNRGGLAIGAALILVLTALALLTTGGKAGLLDPDAYDPDGAHALAVLLEDAGVEVRRTTDLPSTQAAAGPRTTVFAPLTFGLSEEELEALADLPGELVVAGAGPQELVSVDSTIEIKESTDVRDREPGCSSPVARRAGRAELGGWVYEGPDRCYGGSLLALPNRQLTLVGTQDLFTNDRLDDQGNAALSMGLLGQQPTLVWLVPAHDRAVLGTRPVRSVADLLPDWVPLAALQLGLAVVLLALWRARRLGRVVPEPLPVVVLAAETIEGRGRLYRAAHAREVAAEELRGGARQRLGPRVGAGRNPVPETLVTAVAGQTGRSAEQVSALLYGPQPADDAALVRLADDLDALIREVTS